MLNWLKGKMFITMPSPSTRSDTYMVSLDCLKRRHRDRIRCASTLLTEMPVKENGESSQEGRGSYQTASKSDPVRKEGRIEAWVEKV